MLVGEAVARKKKIFERKKAVDFLVDEREKEQTEKGKKSRVYLCLQKTRLHDRVMILARYFRAPGTNR
jgi:hypothetical protein